MDIGAYIAASGAVANERILEQVAHNLANASTPGFRRLISRVETWPFSMPGDGGRRPAPLAFVQAKPPVRSSLQGMVESTGRELDVAIEGKGYFQVQTPRGTRATRDGRFRLGPEGTIVSREGHPVLDDRGRRIQLADPRQPVEIAPNGEVRIAGKRVAKMRIVDEKGRPLEDGAYRITQRSLEMPNLDAVREMVRLMDLARSHGSYMRLIQGFDQLEGKTIQELGRF